MSIEERFPRVAEFERTHPDEENLGAGLIATGTIGALGAGAIDLFTASETITDSIALIGLGGAAIGAAIFATSKAAHAIADVWQSRVQNS